MRTIKGWAEFYFNKGINVIPDSVCICRLTGKRYKGERYIFGALAI